MKVQEFIEYMGKTVNSTMKNEHIINLAKNALEVKNYIPIKEKKDLIDNIIEKCIYFENGTFRIDSIDSYIYFTMLTIDAYTNIEIDDIEECFDTLSESGLMPIVIASLGQEYQDVQTFLNMKRNEIMENNSVEMQVAKFFESALETVGDFSEGIMEVLKNVNIDNESVINAINMFVNR